MANNEIKKKSKYFSKLRRSFFECKRFLKKSFSNTTKTAILHSLLTLYVNLDCDRHTCNIMYIHKYIYFIVELFFFY